MQFFQNNAKLFVLKFIIWGYINLENVFRSFNILNLQLLDR